MNKPFYISTTIPYVNGDPHLGHAQEYIETDAIARYQRLLGKDVFFLSGTDENSLKNVQAAKEVGKEVEDFVEDKAQGFLKFKDSLNIQWDDFIHTREDRHFKGAQRLWKMCEDDIYKKEYKGLYCVGCEMFYKEEELDEEGRCPDHEEEPEVVEEENYFFEITKYKEELKEILEENKVEVYPEFRKNEALQFIENLEDFSISRSEERAHGWGVPVPGDESQIMYVWFDALSNYINALGFAEDSDEYKKYWVQENTKNREVVHMLGKGVLRFHLVYWLGMLLSAGIPLPTSEFVHGYITLEGKKMSKSLGNVLNPHDAVDDYGTDSVRYYMLGAISPFEDGDFSEDRFKDFHNAHLANGVGNLTSRILSMLENYTGSEVPEKIGGDKVDVEKFWEQYNEHFQNFEFDQAVGSINELVSKLDVLISDEKPWEKVKEDEDVDNLLYTYVETLRHVGLALLPIIPESAEEVLNKLNIDVSELENLEQEKVWGKLESGSTISKGDQLFPRL